MDDRKSNPILISIGIITLVVSIIVGIKVVETSEDSSKMLSESIQILNKTNNLLEKQMNEENTSPIVWVNADDFIFNEHDLGLPIENKIDVFFKSNNLMNFEITHTMLKTGSLHKPSVECIFSDPLIHPTMDWNWNSDYTIEPIHDSYSLIKMDVMFFGKIKDDLKSNDMYNSKRWMIGALNTWIDAIDVETNQTMSLHMIQNTFITIDSQHTDKIHQCMYG